VTKCGRFDAVVFRITFSISIGTAFGLSGKPEGVGDQVVPRVTCTSLTSR
jgi:hypothetical protein